MILPEAILGTLKFYEETAVTINEVHHTRFTLHFKQWWKRKHVIDIRWRVTEINGTRRSWQEVQGILDLRNQLETYFASNVRGWNTTI